MEDSNIDYFCIDSASKTQDITILDSKINAILIGSDSSTGYISLHRSILSTLKIRENSKTKEINISKSTIGDIEIDNSSIINSYLDINNSQINELNISSKELRKIEILSCSIVLLQWKQDSFCVLAINNCKIVNFILQQAIIPKDSVFQINNTFINTLKCHQLINTAWLNFSNLNPLESYEVFLLNEKKEYQFKDGKFLFQQLTEQLTIFQLENSDLGKTSFINCDLFAFKEFIFFNTKMLDVFVAGTELPHKISILSEKQKYEQERLAFGQFKKISENRGDNVSATEFLALEMEAYAKQISKHNGKWPEKFNLWLNKFSSNWGNSWEKSVIITLSLNSIFFLFYCISLGYKLGNDWELFFKLASHSLEFLNPLRKADFLLSEITPLARILDYISRIIVAYFTYQTIQAFRRFGRK